MSHKCKVCQNTGMRPLSNDLDCTDCNSAAERAAFNKWRQNELNSIGTKDDDWAIHQRALAMAPKQEAPAGWKLVPEDPTGNMYRAADKIDNEMFAGGSSHGAENGQIWDAMYDAAPAAPQPAAIVAPAFDMVPRQLVREAIADLYTRMKNSYGAEPQRRISFMDMDAVFMHVGRMGLGGCLDASADILAAMDTAISVAAPAAANGAMTDDRILEIRDTSSISAMERLGRMLYRGEENIAFARAILAAAGPNAALSVMVEDLLQYIADHDWGGIPEPTNKIDAIRAALSGAKGN